MSAALPALFALRRTRFSARASACLCLCAFLCVFDGLQALMREDFNRVDLVVGGRTLLSGAMPLDLKDHTEIEADIEGNAGLRFTPRTSFKGFWMGAFMWRGELEAEVSASPGAATLIIRDMVPAKNTAGNATIMVQNPAQIYSITVWPSEAAFLAAQLSLSRLLTGLSPFLLAGFCVLGGVLCGVLHAVRLHKAQRALAEEGIFYVHGVLKRENGVSAMFSPEHRKDLRVGLRMILLTSEGEELGEGALAECGPKRHTALFAPGRVEPRYGQLLRAAPADDDDAAQRN